MSFDVESLIKTAIGGARMFFRSQAAQTNLDAMQAGDELLVEIETLLARPENRARLAKIGRAAAQDLPSLTAPPAPMPPGTPQPDIQDGERGGARGGLMAPGT